MNLVQMNIDEMNIDENIYIYSYVKNYLLNLKIIYYLLNKFFILKNIFTHNAINHIAHHCIKKINSAYSLG